MNEIALTLTRVFDAPRVLVYKMWTDLEHVTRWCCPTGFTVTDIQADFQAGGHYRTVMRSPENTEHRVSGVYDQVIPNECISFTHAWEDENGTRGHESLVTINFEDADSHKTRLTLVQGPMESQNASDMHEGGWGETLDSLTKYLNER